MEFDKRKNYKYLREKIKEAQEYFTHYIFADNSDTISEMCHLQGYIDAYEDLGLITEKQFHKLDEMI